MNEAVVALVTLGVHREWVGGLVGTVGPKATVAGVRP